MAVDNILYALDFDGVICDSAIETGITGWKVAASLWPDMPTETPQQMISLFREVRPVMETGYEAILIMRLLFEGITAESLLKQFATQLDQLIQRDKLNTADLKSRFGETRDQWIKNNLKQWIEMNPLFEGIAEKLRQIDHNNITIITTKQERFVSEILSANQIDIPAEHIYGLDRKLSKQQILSDLQTAKPNHSILFVEDRLPTLLNVINDSRLNAVSLFFANWGYNTVQDKATAQQTDRIHRLDLQAVGEL
ncbi:MAG: hypothetical protein COA90_02655 [Gammaproteobacteria bacterium]|nr:MAG: hypothetical protein COA90_02655 [Gammaproteobacteria bacterium]